MTKEKLYLYLGTNGTILSPVHLEDVYYVTKWRLTADNGKKLIKTGSKDSVYSAVIPTDELSEWREVADETN